MTLKEVKAEIAKFSALKGKELKGITLRPIINVEEVKDGHRTEKMYCTRCGHTDGWLRSGTIHTCEKCDNTVDCQGYYGYRSPGRISKAKSSLESSTCGCKVIHVDENCVIFAAIDVTYKAEFNLSGEISQEILCDGLDKSKVTVSSIYDWFYFDKDKGLRTVGASWGKVPRSSYLPFFQDEMLDLLKNNWTKITGETDVPDNAENMFETMRKFNSATAKKALKRVEDEKLVTEGIMELADSYCPMDYEKLIKQEYKGHSYAIRQSVKAGVVSAKIHCSSCGAKMDMEVPAVDLNGETSGNVTTHCPICGAPLELIQSDYYSVSHNSDGKRYLDFAATDDGDLLIYSFNYEMDLLQEKLRMRSIDCYVFSGNRFFHAKSTNFKTASSPSDWYIQGNGNTDDILASFYPEREIGILNEIRGENLEDVINMSLFAGTGLLEYVKYFSGKSKELYFFPANRRYKIVPYLVSKQAWDLIAELAERSPSKMKSINCKPTGKTFCDFFNCSEEVEKLSMENHLPIDEILSLRDHKLYDSTASYEDINWSYTQYTVGRYGGYHTEDQPLLKLMRKGISLKEIRQYVTALYYRQCIGWEESPRLWLEYLESLEKLELSQNEMDALKMPSSLKKARDIITLAQEYISDEETHSRIGTALKASSSYEFSDADFIIRAPKDENEIIKEGLVQNRSVAQIIELEAAGEKSLMLMRATSDPDTPLYSVEVKGRKVIQARGYQNRQIVDPAALDFLKKWSSAS